MSTPNLLMYWEECCPTSRTRLIYSAYSLCAWFMLSPRSTFVRTVLIPACFKLFPARLTRLHSRFSFTPPGVEHGNEVEIPRLSAGQPIRAPKEKGRFVGGPSQARCLLWRQSGNAYLINSSCPTFPAVRSLRGTGYIMPHGSRPHCSVHPHPCDAPSLPQSSAPAPGASHTADRALTSAL